MFNLIYTSFFFLFFRCNAKFLWKRTPEEIKVVSIANFYMYFNFSNSGISLPKNTGMRWASSHNMFLQCIIYLTKFTGQFEDTREISRLLTTKMCSV